MMVPVNVSVGKLQHLAATFGCSTGNLPFTYLGLPLGLTKPKVEDFLPLVSRCERRLVSTSLFLSQAGRLQITNSVFSSLPTFYMCTFLLHVTVREQIDKFRKHCLWRGSDENNRVNAKAAWTLVTKSKEEGGLGVIDLKTQNEALLLKNLHKFFNRADIPWVHLVWEKHYRNGKLPSHVKKGSFWWKDSLKLLDKFKGMASVSVIDGASCMLWEDGWQGQPFRLALPELYSFTKKPKISIKDATAASSFTSLFNLPLSVEAYGQFQLIQNLLQSLQLSGNPDTWKYIWGNSTFTSKRAYCHLRGSSQSHLIFKWLWKSSCQHKHKVFFWLLTQDRLSTRNILKRKNMQLPSYNCVLCNQNIEETVEHLFLDCKLAKACWGKIGLTVDSSLNPLQIFQSFRLQLGVAFFMEVIIVMSWSIWTLRNNVIFRGIPASTLRGAEIFKDIFGLLLWRAKKKYFPAISSWLEQVV
jgi:hypothetical protein